MVTITEVLPHSRAAKAGIQSGDVLLSINGHEITDVLDYRFYLTDRRITLSLQRKGKILTKKIAKQEYDDIGLGFETPLMDQKQSCHNKCIFCFIDQLPSGLRDTLYFKDDDSRLSFLHGNYITLTNLQDKDIDRIIYMHISPVNISVHTTNAELRVKMMHNKRAGEVLSYMKRLADAGITLCCQIVLCRGINDGEELLQSMRDLEALYPAVSSVSIVPAGLTKYRDKLYPLTPYTKEECANILKAVNTFGDECKRKHGTRLFYPADELYVKAELPLPDNDYYEEYAQIENGVGMLTDLTTAFSDELAYLDELLPQFKAPREVSVCTGLAAYDTLRSLCHALCARAEGLTVRVYPIHNDFFGDEITVAGLLTGTDMKNQLMGKPLGDALLIPAATLRSEGDLFLDGMTPDELSTALGVSVIPTPSDGAALIRHLLGLT
ncbi:MAG: DUF512 domain-containing protein [Ruminococcaceae bacterium]|nr:DUF512 domain-containing protein [Oscillospiraceae bacterium]